MTLTPEQKAEGWIEHDGEECPIRENVSIYAMLRCGIMGWAMRHASAWSWDKRTGEHPGNWTIYGNPTDIIAYREPKP